MVKRRLGIVALATLFNWGCGDKAVTTQPPPPTTPSPTQPISTRTPTQPPPTVTPTRAVTQAPTITPTLTPPQSLVPVVVSVEKVRDLGFLSFVIHGSHFVGYHLKVTFVSNGIPIDLVWTFHSADGTSITASREPPPGSYTPCVENEYGKGCGNFLVTVP